MKRAIRDWPFAFREEPLSGANDIDVSFIIGHRGAERLPHLLSTLSSIASQRNVSCELIVVEQSASMDIKTQIPGWVRYIHTPLPYPEMPYCRSWALNVGARIARGKILVFHDNDMLVPQDYSAQILQRYKEGYEVMNLKRFIFCLSEGHSGKICSTKTLEFNESPETIVQNLEAGGSVAISKKAYFEVGGFDESFLGWGGEDNEFWERAQTLKVWPYGYLPFVHLWHQFQREKGDIMRSTSALYKKRAKIPASTRIQELRVRNYGDPIRISA